MKRICAQTPQLFGKPSAVGREVNGAVTGQALNQAERKSRERVLVEIRLVPQQIDVAHIALEPQQDRQDRDREQLSIDECMDKDDGSRGCAKTPDRSQQVHEEAEIVSQFSDGDGQPRSRTREAPDIPGENRMSAHLCRDCRFNIAMGENHSLVPIGGRAFRHGPIILEIVTADVSEIWIDDVEWSLPGHRIRLMS